MKMPNRESAYVPSAKLNGYLLSEVHPVGKAKAQFLKNLGYDISSSSTLERDLLTFARECDVAQAPSISPETPESPEPLALARASRVNSPANTSPRIERLTMIPTESARLHAS